MSQRNVITSRPNLQALAPLRRWVAYSGAPKEGKIDKAPLNPKTGRPARNDSPATWDTRQAAEARAKALKEHGHKPGVGIELGDLGDGSRRKLVAVRGWAVEDLDAEIAADTFKPKGGTNAA